MKKKKQNLRDLWDTIKHANIWIILVPERKERKRQKEYLKK